MSQLATLNIPAASREFVPSTRLLTFAMLGLAAAAALLAGWVPLGFSIVSVFLFAGPHNWFEARYFLSRLPGRWGKLRTYFLVGFGGVFALTIGFALFPWIAEACDWEPQDWATASALWNTLLLLWIVVLIQMSQPAEPAPRLVLDAAGGLLPAGAELAGAASVGARAGLLAPADGAVDSRSRAGPFAAHVAAGVSCGPGRSADPSRPAVVAAGRRAVAARHGRIERYASPSTPAPISSRGFPRTSWWQRTHFWKCCTTASGSSPSRCSG